MGRPQEKFPLLREYPLGQRPSGVCVPQSRSLT